MTFVNPGLDLQIKVSFTLVMSDVRYKNTARAMRVSAKVENPDILANKVAVVVNVST